MQGAFPSAGRRNHVVQHEAMEAMGMRFPVREPVFASQETVSASLSVEKGRSNADRRTRICERRLFGLRVSQLDIQMAIQRESSLVGGEGQQHIEGVVVGAINV